MPPQIMIKNKKGLVNILSNNHWKGLQCIFLRRIKWKNEILGIKKETMDFIGGCYSVNVNNYANA